MKQLFINYFILICILSAIYCEQIGLKSRQYSQLRAGIATTAKPVTYDHVNASTDAQAIYDAVVGIGTNETAIINILANRRNSERQFLKRVYHEMFQKELLKDLKGDASGNFRRVVKSLLLEPQEFIASQLNKALVSLLSDENTVIEILCTRSKDELIPVLNAYEKLFNKTLKGEIDECVDGDQRTFLKAIISDPLREKAIVDTVEANSQLNIIPNVADFCSVPKNPALKDFFAKESFEQIHLVCELHQKEKRLSVEEQLKRWCTTDDVLQSSYVSIVRFANDRHRYFAEQLYNAMVGLGTDDKKLIRIIVSRSEIDLSNIKKKYKELYNDTLESAVASETSGYYQKILLKLLERADVTGVYHSYY